MAQTPNSAAAAYISAPNFLLCYSQAIVADMLRATPTSPQPSYSAIIDSTNPAGAKLLYHLKCGGGEIEAYCAVAKRYTPADLQALTGVSLVLLQKLNAARAMWSLAQFLKPITARQEDVPMAKESTALLELLSDGELIFGLTESMDAGLVSVVPPNPNALVTGNAVGYAMRLFPNSTLNRMLGGGN